MPWERGWMVKVIEDEPTKKKEKGTEKKRNIR